MRGWATCVLGALCACGGSKGGAPDAAIVIDTAVAIDTDGQALTAGADDPATNTSSILTNPFPAKPYLMKLDCKCYASPSGCGQLTAPCAIAGANTPVYTAQACNQSRTTMDENGEWLAVFGAHS